MLLFPHVTITYDAKKKKRSTWLLRSVRKSFKYIRYEYIFQKKFSLNVPWKQIWKILNIHSDKIIDILINMGIIRSGKEMMVQLY